MIFRHFQEEAFSALHKAFITSFSSNKVPFNPSFDAFQLRMKNKLALNPQLSALAVEGDQCLGFVLQTMGSYEGILTIYNGGTGVIPSQRGQNITMKLFEFLSPQMAQSKAQRILLEVITTNEPALKVYKKLGFQYRKTFKCYKRRNTAAKLPATANTKIKKVQTPDFESYHRFADFSPSFIDNTLHLRFNLKNEIILEAWTDDEMVGYAIFQPHLGRISQLGVTHSHRNKGVGRLLINQIQLFSVNKELTIINIPDTYQPMLGFLSSLGFQNEVDQYEMELLF